MSIILNLFIVLLAHILLSARLPAFRSRTPSSFKAGPRLTRPFRSCAYVLTSVRSIRLIEIILIVSFSPFNSFLSVSITLQTVSFLINDAWSQLVWRILRKELGQSPINKMLVSFANSTIRLYTLKERKEPWRAPCCCRIFLKVNIEFLMWSPDISSYLGSKCWEHFQDSHLEGIWFLLCNFLFVANMVFITYLMDLN